MGLLRTAGAGEAVGMDDLAFDFEADIDTKDALRKASLKADGINTTAESASATTRGRHSIVCKHWMKDLCMKGDKCDFLHQFDPSRMPECMLWLKFGKCTDPDCTFRHVANADRPECQRYRLGFCRYGLICRSRHDRLPKEGLPDILPDWFLNSLIVNAYLIPRTEDLPVPELRERLRNGSAPRGIDATPPSERPPPMVAGATMMLVEQGPIPGLLPPVNGKCRFFNVRSMNVRNIQISAAKGIWATSLGNSQKFKQSLRDVEHVILIFSATESRTFCGYGKMVSEPDDTLLPGVWGDMSSRLSPSFRVHWLKQCSLSLQAANHIKNPQQEDLPVQRCRDGQELPSSIGERLCRLLWQQSEVDLVKGSDFEFEPRVSYEHLAKEVGRSSTPKDSPLALEDARSAEDRERTTLVDDRVRPAPERLGTFDAAAKARNAVTFGKALASGSSSLAQALAEEGRTYGGHHAPHHGWPPMHGPPHGMPGPWRPPPMDPHGMLPSGRFGHPPPPGFFSHHHAPPGYPPFHGMPPPVLHGPPSSGLVPRRPPGMEAPPPGFWGGASGGAPAAAPERTLGRPPSDWEGASSAVVSSRDGDNSRRRSRSRSRRKRRRN